MPQVDVASFSSTITGFYTLYLGCFFFFNLTAMYTFLGALKVVRIRRASIKAKARTAHNLIKTALNFPWITL